METASPPIPDPDPYLEQYTTPGDIAARLASTISLRDPLNSLRIADLGAGTCRLSLALTLYGADSIIAVDADRRLAYYCLQAFKTVNLDEPSYIVSWIREDEGPLRPGEIDIIVMNPPFGVQRRGADSQFIAYALNLKPGKVYAILKTGNEAYHSRLAREKGYKYIELYTEWFPIPATMKHHKSRIRRVRVSVAVFEKAQ